MARAILQMRDGPLYDWQVWGAVALQFKDYYDILGVSETARAEEIQKAYRKLARQYHPDVNSDPEAEGQFKEVGEAYDVLKDPSRRMKYDRYGAFDARLGCGVGGGRLAWIVDRRASDH